MQRTRHRRPQPTLSGHRILNGNTPAERLARENQRTRWWHIYTTRLEDRVHTHTTARTLYYRHSSTDDVIQFQACGSNFFMFPSFLYFGCSRLLSWTTHKLPNGSWAMQLSKNQDWSHTEQCCVVHSTTHWRYLLPESSRKVR